MKLLRTLGATSQILQIFIADSSSTIGAGLAGLTSASSGLTAYYHRDTDTTATAISLVTMTVGTFTSSGFKEIDSTNMPGWYQFCPPNAALATGASSVGLHLKGAANMMPLPIEIDLAGPGAIWDVTTASHTTSGTFGGSTITAPPNFGALSISGGGDVAANVVQWNATAVNGSIPPDVGFTLSGTSSFTGSGTTITLNGGVATNSFYNNQIVVLTGGTGKGQSATITGYVGSTQVATINGTWATNPDGTTTFAVIAGGAGGSGSAPTVAQIATAVWQDVTAGDFTTSGSIGKSLFTSGAVPGASGGLFIAGSNAATTANITGNITGNLSGTVGSVTGAVGSVTGAVGSIASGGITAGSFAAFAEGYTTLGTAGTYTLPKMIFDIHRRLYARSVSATTETIFDMDGTTPAHTITLNSSTTPTSAIQAT